jgi:hypothetical protein
VSVTVATAALKVLAVAALAAMFAGVGAAFACVAVELGMLAVYYRALYRRNHTASGAPLEVEL